MVPLEEIPAVPEAELGSLKDYSGCQHYPSVKCKVYASCCSTWVPCRLCHDSQEPAAVLAGSAFHQLDRFKIRFVLCMECGTAQECSNQCKNCAVQFALYFCSVCNLWSATDDRKIYHCDQCNLCRLGERSRFVHCERCACCLTQEYWDGHRCIEQNLNSDCAICGDYLFTSTIPVMFMRCGHAIHGSCFTKMELRGRFTCPICQKSVKDMEDVYRRIDQEVEEQKMPEEFQLHQAEILCNDCGAKTQVKYHFVYNKCGSCRGYNTNVIKIIKPET